MKSAEIERELRELRMQVFAVPDEQADAITARIKSRKLALRRARLMERKEASK